MAGEKQTAGKRDSSEETRVEAEGRVLQLDTGQDAPDSRVDNFKQLELKLDHLTEEEQQRLKSILTSYGDVFALDSSELGTTDAVTHSIDTGDHRQVREQVRHSPFALRATVDKLIKEMMEQQVIEPSSSPSASPIVLVQKREGRVRFCVDYRKLNQLTKFDEFPLLRIDDTLDLLT